MPSSTNTRFFITLRSLFVNALLVILFAVHATPICIVLELGLSSPTQFSLTTPTTYRPYRSSRPSDVIVNYFPAGT